MKKFIVRLELKNGRVITWKNAYTKQELRDTGKYEWMINDERIDNFKLILQKEV